MDYAYRRNAKKRSSPAACCGKSSLASSTHLPPKSRFTLQSHGKPCLADNTLDNRIHFNLSHTAGRVLLAATCDRDVGVDIERIRTHLPHEELARRFFSPTEYLAIAALPPADRPRAFFTTWCRKEAILKTTGQGIAAGLNTFDVPVTPMAHPFTVSHPNGTIPMRWTLHDLHLSEPYLACVAVDACAATLRTWQVPAH